MNKLDPFAHAAYRVQPEPYTFSCEEYPELEITLFLKPLDIISTFQVLEQSKILTERHTGPKAIPYKIRDMLVPLSEALIQSLVTVLMMETRSADYPFYTLDDLIGIIINLPHLWLAIQEGVFDINNKKKLSPLQKMSSITQEISQTQKGESTKLEGSEPGELQGLSLSG